MEDKALQDLITSLENGYRDRVAKITQELLDKGVAPEIILKRGLIVGMTLVGEKMKKNEMYLPEVLLSASAMQSSLKVLKPYLVRDRVESRGKVVLGTVKGDMHDIGKNLVGIMLQGSGFEIIDLGTNVTPEMFADAIKTHQPVILGLSAMLTTTMLNMKTTIDYIGRHGLRSKLRIIIGGASVRQQFADEIGADGYARDAVAAVEKVKEFLG
jgi:5-methyltetrahydrofolate--homocysteine methyltransferase